MSFSKRKVLTTIQPDTPSRRVTFSVSKPSLKNSLQVDKENKEDNVGSLSPLSFEKHENTESKISRMGNNVLASSKNKFDVPLLNGAMDRRQTYHIPKSKDQTKRALFCNSNSGTSGRMHEDRNDATKPKQTSFLKRKSVSQTLPSK